MIDLCLIMSKIFERNEHKMIVEISKEDAIHMWHDKFRHFPLE